MALSAKELISTIEGLMSENETIKTNAMKATIAKGSDTARRMYGQAKAENNAYLKVLNLIKESEVENG